jgi:hypothetical protein
MDTCLERLKLLAQAAQASDCGDAQPTSGEGNFCIEAFSAAASPAIVLSLIDAIECLQAENIRAQALLKVRDTSSVVSLAERRYAAMVDCGSVEGERGAKPHTS